MLVNVNVIYYVHLCEQARLARSAGNSAIENLCIIIDRQTETDDGDKDRETKKETDRDSSRTSTKEESAEKGGTKSKLNEGQMAH